MQISSIMYLCRSLQLNMEETTMNYCSEKKIYTKWADLKNAKYKKYKYILMYTIIFLLLAVCVFISYINAGRSFIWIGANSTANAMSAPADGFVQHYNSLVYYGQYLRNIFKTIFINHSFNIPMWDFSLGYGADIITTLHYYVAGDPLNLLAVFFKPAYTEYLYNFLVLLRLYLAGLSFSAYCFYHNKKTIYILPGAFIYAFSGFALFAAVRHPFFANPMIYMPLIFIGIDSILSGKKPYLFIIMIFVSALSNFYFLFSLTLLTIIYAVIRFFSLNFKKNEHFFKDLIFTVLKTSGYYLTGVLMAGVIFIPVIYLFATDIRSKVNIEIPILYGLKYYRNFAIGLISSTKPNTWTAIGISAAGFTSVIALFCKRKKHFTTKLIYIILFVLLLIPYAGHVFNGFSYATNRWSYGYCFAVSYIVTAMLPELSDLNKNEKKRFGIISAFYLLLCILMCDFHQSRYDYYISIIILLITVLIILLFSKCKFIGNSHNGKRRFYGILYVLAATGIISNSFFQYNYRGYDYTNEFMQFGSGYKYLQQTAAKSISQLDDDSFFRYDQKKPKKKYLLNSSLVYGQNGLCLYYSLSNGNVVNFLTDSGVNDIKVASKYVGVDNRTYLEALACTKYYVSENKYSEAIVPYGFKKIDEDGKLKIYQNMYALPIGYSYTSYMTEDEYDKLNAAEKQEVLLQNAVLENGSEIIDKGIPEFSQQNIEYTSSSDDVTITSKYIIVKNAGSKVTLSFEGIDNSETYLLFNNLKFNGTEFRHEIREGLYLGKTELKHYQKGNVYIKVKDNTGISKKIRYLTPSYIWYFNKNDYMVNMGYSQNGKTQIELTFDSPGTYKFDSLDIICQPMDNYEQRINNLKADCLENVNVNFNNIKGTVSAGQNEFMCFSVPYSNGWEIFIDGKKSKLIKANGMYMAAEITKGNHFIELKYKTPGILTGLLSSAVGMITFIGIVIFHRKKRTSA